MPPTQKNSYDIGSFPRIGKLGRSAHLVRIEDGGLGIVKSEPPATGHLLQRISRRLVGGSIPFRNEGRVAREMRQKKLRHLNSPQLLDIAEDSLLFEYIEGAERRDYSTKQRMQLVAALAEYSSYRLPAPPLAFERLLLRVIESPLCVCLRDLAGTQLPKREKLYYLLRFARLYWTLPRRRLFTLHNDLAFSNILADQDENIFIIDFEDTIAERRMVLQDAVDAFSDVITGIVDTHAILDTAAKMGLDVSSKMALCDLSRCLHASYFKKSIKALRSARFDVAEKAIVHDRLRTIIECSAIPQAAPKVESRT